MNLLVLTRRTPVPEPWSEGEKIPWDDPEFSRRMLNAHLSQEHDAASRRFQIIDRHVQWIHGHVLNGVSTRVLDLGCGPGLYTSRLARLGHECVGIDFSPASIEYAREHNEGLNCRYVLEDIRKADYGDGYGLVMMIFGEFNVFRRDDARLILRKAYSALEEGGFLLLEPHTYEAVKAQGEEKASWYSAESGLFSDDPYICLTECFWNEELQAATERYYIMDCKTARVTPHASSMQAYTDEQFEAMLRAAGFIDIEFYESLQGSLDSSQKDFHVALCRKPHR